MTGRTAAANCSHQQAPPPQWRGARCDHGEYRYGGPPRWNRPHLDTRKLGASARRRWVSGDRRVGVWRRVDASGCEAPISDDI